MATTLQKEYALIYYIQKALKQTEHNGFLHELYTPEAIKRMVETLVENNTKDQPTINVSNAVEDILNKVNINNFVNPNQLSEKTKLLPYDTTSFMQMCMGKTVDRTVLNMKQRLFIDDITEAKDGLAAYFVSTFTVKNMIHPSFEHLVKMDKRPDADEIANELHKRYPNSPLFKGAKDMSELDAQVAPLVAPLTKNQFTYYDLDSLFRALDNYPNVLDKISLTNAVNAVIKGKQEESPHTTFDAVRDHNEVNVKTRIKEAPSIDEFFKKSCGSRFVGTIKYKRNGTIDGANRENVIDVSLRKEDRRFDDFIDVINRLLAIEGEPEVTTGYFKDKRSVLLTERQYHVLFPEYFITVGAIKEKVSTESDMGGSTMKSGDEKTSVIDSYSREDNNYEEEEDDSFNSPDLYVGKTKKLMFAKMLATINGHPDTVPDMLESNMGTKAMIYNLNRILITELFNTSYDNIVSLDNYLHTGQIPDKWSDDTASALHALRDTYLKEQQAEHRQYAERDTHVKAFATILSELARLAKMDPQSEFDKRSQKYGSNDISNQDVTLTCDGYTYVLSNASLSTIVNLMIKQAVQGKFVASATLTNTDALRCALGFLKDSGLLNDENKVCRLDSDADSIKQTIDGLDWDQLPTIHHSMMSTALRNCSYIFKHNGWEPMSNDELSRSDVAPIQDEKKKTTQYDDIQTLISVVEGLQGQIKPYVLNLKAVNYIIDLIKKQYNIAELSPVEAPTVDEDTLSITDNVLHSFVTDDSAEAFDKFSQGYYISHITDQYNELVENTCENIKKVLTKNHLFNEGTRATLLSKVNNSGRPAKIITDIFGEKKVENNGLSAEDFNRIEMRNIFTIAQDTILLYNKALSDLRTKNPAIASNFYNRLYVTAEEVNLMSSGKTPSGKMYTEKGNPCRTAFLLNAYLIDILFEALYIISVNFDLQTEKTYTAQEVISMKDVDEMKEYINHTLNIKVNDTRYSQLLNTVNSRARINLLFNSDFLNLVSVVFVTHPEVKQLTIGSYKNISGDTTNVSIDKMMQGIAEKKTNRFDSKNKQLEDEYEFRRLFRPS